MKIVKIVCSTGLTGFFFDDQKAIKSGALKEGECYFGTPLTPDFSQVRQPGESLSIMLFLSDRQIAWGDCAVVQYSGTAGRDPLFIADTYRYQVEEFAEKILLNQPITTFRSMVEQLETYRDSFGKPLHKGVSYGLSQAILDAVAKSQHKLMCEIIAQEYGLTISQTMLPIFCQTGDNRYDHADKMIIKHVDVIPHGLFNNIEHKIGAQGEKLKEYILWLKERILQFRPTEDYHPVIHIDVYGLLGDLFHYNLDQIEDYLVSLVEVAAPFSLRVEGPVDMGNQADQIIALRHLTEKMNQRGGPKIVADEWCNTLEDIRLFADQAAGHMIQIKTPDLGGVQNCVVAVLYCQKAGVEAYLGGTCNETEKSAQVCTHVAMATQPDQVLAKPGMGVDEGLMIVKNEMSRILAILAGN